MDPDLISMEETASYTDTVVNYDPPTSRASTLTTVYPFRWVILALYSLTAFANTLMWLSLFTITDATCAFYNVNETVFLWSSNAFTFLQVIAAFPISFAPSRFGLRPTMVVATAINAIGACIMIAGAQENGFVFFVLGQCVISISACILPQLAPEVAAVWFGEHERATATSIGIIMGNLGAAIGFLQPALLMKDVDLKNDMDVMEDRLEELIYSQASLCILMLFFVVLLFRDQPLKPPSLSQLQRHGPGAISFTDFKNSVKQLLTNRDYHFSGNAYALASALLIVVPVTLNQIVAWRIPNEDTTVGWMGFTGVLIGLLGSILFGLVLDKTQAFKALAFLLSFASALFWLGFSSSLIQWQNIVAAFTFFVISLFVFIPFGPVVVDMISEITYPISSSTAYVIPITLGRIYSIVFIFLVGWLIQTNRQNVVCYLVASVIGLCSLLTLITRVDRKRAKVEGTIEDTYSGSFDNESFS